MIPKRYSHVLFAIIQSGITTAAASGIASVQIAAGGAFVVMWLRSWLIAWIAILPLVILIAPLIRKAVDALTADRPTRSGPDRIQDDP